MIIDRNMMNETIEQLLNEVSRNHREHGRLTDEVLSALRFVFQAPLLSALDLVDKEAVTTLESPSGRKVYQVVGTSGTPYTCYENSNFCCCPAYKFSVLKKNDHIMCKHVLAIELSNRLEKTKREQVNNQELCNIIQQIMN
ncbi:zinc finger SWIM domain-containing protein 7-like [Tubulanus polymorphus]|uniref:zinc finger SWIM domain-containing protein 7-like n=1 Tax=Tubulanus polymorphus TaxID=672921 RepID=UPI003DA62F2C